jgi:hypothetical protein
MHGVYPFASSEPDGAIVLHSGPVKVAHEHGDNTGTGRVWLDPRDGLTVRWEFETDSRLELGDAVLTVNRPGLGDVMVSAHIMNSAGSGSIAHAALGDSMDLSYVIVHWFNLPAILPCLPLAMPGGGAYGGRWVCEASGWRLTLDQRSDHASAVDDLRGTAHAALTHLGRLERVDGSSFTSADADQLLSGLQTALSFATGRWVAPALPVGYDANGRVRWEQWANWRCSRFHGFFGWWDSHRSEDLAELCQRFLDHWLDEGRHAAIRHATYHAICASSDESMLEARVALAQSGFEYLAWVTNVLEDGRSANEYKGVPAHEKLKDMLMKAKVPTSIPNEFNGLAALAPVDKQTGPLATTWLRNKLVHPKDASQPYRIESAIWNCWLLSVEYLELLLLWRLGYRGNYLPKRPGIWAHQSKPVPWGALSPPL